MQKINRLWLSHEFLTVDQAAALLAGIDPVDVVPNESYFENIDTGSRYSEGIGRFLAAKSFLIDAARAHRLAAKLPNGEKLLEMEVKDWPSVLVEVSNLCTFLDSVGVVDGFFVTEQGRSVTPTNEATNLAQELARLREQLEAEQAARKAAETALEDRKAQDGKRTLEGMRDLLSHPPQDFTAMQHRAEKAERMVNILERRLEEQIERQRTNEKLFEEMTRRHGKEQSDAQADARPEEQGGGLVFPYTTKTLQAMHEAAVEFWEGYTPDKRPPTQKAIGLTLGEMLSLPRQKNGDPARKAIALASAIKPDDLPDC